MSDAPPVNLPVVTAWREIGPAQDPSALLYRVMGHDPFTINPEPLAALSRRCERHPMTRSAWLVAALALGRVAFGFQFQSVASLGPTLMGQYGLSYAALGTLIGLYMAPGILVALPGGVLGRRYGGRVLVGSGFVLMTLGALIAAGVGGPQGIGAGRLLAGMGAVALIVMQGKLAADRFTGTAFVTVMGLLVGMFPIGVGLSGLALAPIVAWGGPAAMFAIGAALSALSGLLLLGAPPGGGTAATFAWPSKREVRLVLVAGLIWTAYNSGYYGFLSYVPSVLAARGHPPRLAALVLTVATWTNLPATLAGGWLSGRFGGARVLVWGTVAAVGSIVGLAVLDWPLLFGLVFGTLGSVQAGVIVALGTLSARPQNQAVGMGLFYTVYFLGVASFPGLCGLVGDAWGSPAAALFAAGLLGTLALPAFWLHRHLSVRSPFAA